MILECRANEQQGQLRMLSRKALLTEIRSVAVLPTGAAPGALLQPRDVRKVDPFFAARLEPAIIVRSGCILLSLGRTELRAIITHERLYFVVPNGADSILTTVQNNLAKLRAHELPHAHDGTKVPFELAALEAMLITACASLHTQQAALAERVGRALVALRRTVIGARVVAGDQQLEAVRELKQEARELQLQAQALERALARALDQDDDMTAMYLTRHTVTAIRREQSRMGSPGWEGEVSEVSDSTGHEEVETMLESYVQDVGSTLGAMEELNFAIESTEKFVSFRLDSARNRLLKVEVIATVGGGVLSLGSVVSGFFGMNLTTSLYDDAHKDTLFAIVAGCTAGVILLFGVLIMYYYIAPTCSVLNYCRKPPVDPLARRNSLPSLPPAPPPPAASKWRLHFRRKPPLVRGHSNATPSNADSPFSGNDHPKDSPHSRAGKPSSKQAQ